MKGGRGELPAHVLLPRPMGRTGGNLPHGQSAGYLGKNHDPFVLNADPSVANFKVPDLLPPDYISPIRAERRPSDLLVSIANTGEGIPPDDLDRVFERFYRVEKSRDRERGGAGIGLAIVKQLVEAGGGRVGAESANGLTRFWFSVPA